MTVYDNLAFSLEMRKFSKEEINQRVREAADLLEISELLQRKPKQLSGGQRQKSGGGKDHC
jgi:multiple sugar transport system ATP-binding protein